MLVHRLLSSAVGSASTRQFIRPATTWASTSLPNSSTLAKSQSPSSSSSSTGNPTSINRNTTNTNNGSGNSRGRSKPHRSATTVRARSYRQQSTSSPPHSAFGSFFTPSEPARKTQGRRRPSSLRTTTSLPPKSESIFAQCQIPQAKDYSFRPVPLYPQPLHLHMAFTPPHQPIMANLGTKRYLQTSLPSSEIIVDGEELFRLPEPSSPANALRRQAEKKEVTIGYGRTGLSDHIGVLNALGHPAHHRHLISPPTSAHTEDSETHLMRVLAEADVKHQLSAEWAFESVLAKLGDKSVKKENTGVVVDPQGGKEEMDAALKGLDGVLERLALGTTLGSGRSKEVGKGMKVEVKVIRIGGMNNGEIEVEDMGVLLDSVKRKRKKKISKHKYKKRRKETRAQRKRLGK